MSLNYMKFIWQRCWQFNNFQCKFV